MKPINLSRPASLIWSFGFFICLVFTFFYFYILGKDTFPTIQTPINIVAIALDYWFFSLPLSIIYLTFIIRYYQIIRKKYKSTKKEYLAILSTMLMLGVFPTILFCAALLQIISSYLAFIPLGILIFTIIIVIVLRNIKQTSF